MPRELLPSRFRRILEVLVGAEVEFVLIGGLAAIVHGSSRATYDVDVVYARSAINLRRLAAALGPFNPYLRGAPPGLPFQWDEQTLNQGLNFTLTSDLGDLDLLGEVTGGGRYEDLLSDCVEIEVFGVRCRCLGLQKLIQLKRAAGRPKDLEGIAELEAIVEERQGIKGEE